MVRSLEVQIWSDIACPWCYVGKRHWEAALREFEHADAVRLRWRSFELDPSARTAKLDPSARTAKLDPSARAVTSDDDYVGRLAKKYGTTHEQAQAMIDRMVGVASQAGIEMRFDRIRSGNTFDAHRLLHLAHERGRQNELKERLLRAYFCEGALMSDGATLASLAGEVGLDVEEASFVLNSDAHAAEVRTDEATARQLGINGVPFFVIGHYGVSGAQPAAVLGQVLRKAWADARAEDDAPNADAASTEDTASADAASTDDAAPGCDGDSCAV
ncbi:MAG: DsbA family oxidoreductase [Polyangiaceae bacterium]